MKKLLLLLLPVLVFACTDYTEDFNTINDRLDKLEQTIPTIEEQFTSIQTSIDALKAIDKELDDNIKALEESDKATAEDIAALKEADKAIELRMAELQKYVDDSLKSAKDWVIATFATLEQLNTLSSEIVTLKNLIDTNETESAANLATAIATLETSLKSWVGEQLSNYYTIAEVEAKITTLQTAITEGDNALQEELNKLKTQLSTTATQITAAYKKAIEEAITTNNGVINNKITSEIAAVNQRIASEVATINAKIAGLQAQVNQNTADIAKLLARIQSVSYIPRYDDGKATLEYASRISHVKLDFKISPKETVSELAKVWQSAVSVKAVYTETRAVSFIDMPIIRFEADEQNGVITLTASGENLVQEVFSAQKASIALDISDGNNSITSTYIPLVTKEVDILDLFVPSNEIWYTSTDGKIVEPTRPDAFDANIVSNTYKDGMGILKFDGNVTHIYLYAFCNQETQVGAENLETIKFPNGLAEIGEYAFCNCTSLAEVLVPPTLTKSNAQAFEGCTNLIRVDISDLSAWCKIAFPGTINGFPLYNDAKLYLDSVEVTNLDIPSDIDSIKGGAFCGCSSIISIDIPSNVTEIRSHAFYRCKNLAIVYCRPIIPPSITLGSPSGKWLAFSSNAKGRMIYVPRESVKAYKSADGWSDYADYIVGYDF